MSYFWDRNKNHLRILHNYEIHNHTNILVRRGKKQIIRFTMILDNNKNENDAKIKTNGCTH